jgi:hypothetical protein
MEAKSTTILTETNTAQYYGKVENENITTKIDGINQELILIIKNMNHEV